MCACLYSFIFTQISKHFFVCIWPLNHVSWTCIVLEIDFIRKKWDLSTDALYAYGELRDHFEDFIIHEFVWLPSLILLQKKRKVWNKISRRTTTAFFNLVQITLNSLFWVSRWGLTFYSVCSLWSCSHWTFFTSLPKSNISSVPMLYDA